MWHSRFFGILLVVLALLGFMGSQTALAAYPTPSEFSMSQPQETRGLAGSFQLAVMGDSAIPLNIPPQQSPKKASKPKKKKVKKANVKKAPAKKPVEEEGFLTKTFKQLIGGDDDKKETASKSQLQKTAGKKPEKEEEGFLTKTLKTLMGGDTKNEKKAEKNTLNPINMAPTGSSAQKKEEEQPKTAKSETKKPSKTPLKN